MTQRDDAPPLIDKLRAHGKASDSIAWNGQARQLLLWAADAIEAANAALRSETAPSVAKDAARYRFLRTRVSHRDGETLSPAKCYYRRWHHDTTFKPDADTHAGMFDAAIDAGMQNAAPQGNKAGTPLVEAGKGSASSTDRTLPNEPAEPASPACASPNSAVLSEVNAERERQDEKWGGAEHDDSHDTTVFVQLIEDYAGWARVMAGRQNGLKARRRLIQVAALAVAAVESIDRRDANWNEHG